MKTVDWYFDFISPFAYLQSEQLEHLPETVQVNLKPILFAGLLKHWGTVGPAELASKRVFTYRHVHWLGQKHNIPLKVPPAHPFNPLPPLRLAIALNNKEAMHAIFRFIWGQGNRPDQPDEWQALVKQLNLTVDEANELVSAADVKETLRRNTEEAIADGVFGVPTFVVDDELFWGFDATEMVVDYLQDPATFIDAEMQRISDLPIGMQRK